MSSISVSRRWLAWGVVLFVLAVLRWHGELLWQSPRVDEIVYVDAANSVLSGGSPYDAPRFVYNPPFALLVAWGIEHLGTTETLILLRFLGLLGGVLMIWGPLATVTWRWRALGLALLLLLFSPIVTNNVTYGNVSFLILALAMLGLLGSRSSPGRGVPIVGPVLLGVSVGLKPMAAAAIPLWALSGGRDGVDRRRLGASVIAGVTAVGLQLFGLRFLAGLWSHAGGLPTTPHNIALSRVLYCFGVQVSSVVIMGLVTLGAIVWLWRRTLSNWELLAVCGVVSVLGLPSVSLHTMAFTYPIQVLAVDRLMARRRTGQGSRLELAWVGLAVLAIHSGHGVGSMGMLALPAQGALMALPVLAPLSLAYYVVEGDRTAGPASRNPKPVSSIPPASDVREAGTAVNL